MIKQIDTSRIKPRVIKIQRLTKGLERVHRKIVKEHQELIKDLDAYHKGIVSASLSSSVSIAHGTDGQLLSDKQDDASHQIYHQ